MWRHRELTKRKLSPVVIFLSPQCLYGCYVHSSIIPTFHRRCYWLLQVGDDLLLFSWLCKLTHFVVCHLLSSENLSILLTVLWRVQKWLVRPFWAWRFPFHRWRSCRMMLRWSLKFSCPLCFAPSTLASSYERAPSLCGYAKPGGPMLAVPSSVCQCGISSGIFEESLNLFFSPPCGQYTAPQDSLFAVVLPLWAHLSNQGSLLDFLCTWLSQQCIRHIVMTLPNENMFVQLLVK